MDNNIRGKIDESCCFVHKSESYGFLLSKLQNLRTSSSEKTAVIRIIGDKFFRNNEEELAPLLLNLIVQGCSLYTKIEIQSVLSTGGEYTAKLLISKLGLIGHNQHLVVSSKTSNKSTYPIARDICARILQKMAETAHYIYLNFKEDTFEDFQKSEALDVLGYCIFHNNRLINAEIIQVIIHETKSNNSVCRWKAIRALSGFKGNVFVINHLREIYSENNLPVINFEIARSLNFVK